MYSLIAAAVVVIYLLLSKKIESETNTKQTSALSKESRPIVGRLSALFAVDSFAGGFVIQSIVSYWFFTKFGIDLPMLAMIFSVAGVLTAFSFLIATRRRQEMEQVSLC